MTIELEEPPLTQDNLQVYKDLFGGTVGGIAQVLVGQPFDTVKVRLQSAPDGIYSGAGDVIKKLLANEGPKGFYKGTLMKRASKTLPEVCDSCFNKYCYREH